MRYLNPVSRPNHRENVSHILSADGVSALCVMSQAAHGYKPWPRVCDGEWIAGDTATALHVCLRCRNIQDAPPKAATARKSREHQERKRLAEWNRAASEFNRGKA